MARQVKKHRPAAAILEGLWTASIKPATQPNIILLAGHETIAENRLPEISNMEPP